MLCSLCGVGFFSQICWELLQICSQKCQSLGSFSYLVIPLSISGINNDGLIEQVGKHSFLLNFLNNLSKINIISSFTVWWTIPLKVSFLGKVLTKNLILLFLFQALSLNVYVPSRSISSLSFYLRPLFIIILQSGASLVPHIDCEYLLSHFFSSVWLQFSHFR